MERAKNASSVPDAEPASGAQPVRVGRAVREALESFATPEVADAILRDAVARYGGELPTDAESLEAFVGGALRAATITRLDLASADAIAARVRPLVDILARIEASEAAASEPILPTRELGKRPFAIVLVLGRDPSVAADLRGRLPRTTAVLPVDDGTVLARDLRLLGTQSKMLLVDRRAQNDLLDGVLDPGLLTGALIMLWGATRSDAAEVRARFPQAYDVLWADGDASIEDLGALVRLGRG